ncbi:hypothetical protein [Azohydromonas aeria]|uniref:hypothetical protein n=1 Tax=Azohydromonas aeria TaxID=2590212 RepID=UPI0012F75CCE|nr:hypothetical protein [Azohydromonas aeria]
MVNIEKNIDDGEILAELRAAHDLARRNLARALSNAIIAFGILNLAVMVDSGFLNSLAFAGSLSVAGQTLILISRWSIALCATLYLLWSLGHIMVSVAHLREVNSLWRKVY